MGDGFLATHVVREEASAWDSPDPGAAPVASLWAGLPVIVVDRQGHWARIRCENGWEAWSDARLLDDVAAVTAAETPVEPEPASPLPPASPPQAPLQPTASQVEAAPTPPTGPPASAPPRRPAWRLRLPWVLGGLGGVIVVAVVVVLLSGGASRSTRGSSSSGSPRPPEVAAAESDSVFTGLLRRGALDSGLPTGYQTPNAKGYLVTWPTSYYGPVSGAQTGPPTTRPGDADLVAAMTEGYLGPDQLVRGASGYGAAVIYDIYRSGSVVARGGPRDVDPAAAPVTGPAGLTCSSVTTPSTSSVYCWSVVGRVVVLGEVTPQRPASSADTSDAAAFASAGLARLAEVAPSGQ